MILFKRILPILAPLALVGALEVLVAQKHLFWHLVPLTVLIAIAPAAHMARWRFESRDFWYFTIAPLTLVAAALFLLVFLSNMLFIHLLIVLTAFVIGWYLENLFLFLYQPAEYQPYALEHIAAYLTLFVIFFFYSALVASRVFLDVSLFLLFPIGVVMTALTATRLLWGMKIPLRRGWMLIAVYTAIMAELLLAVLLLPTSYFVGGLLLTVPHYLMMNIARYALRDQLTSRVVRRYTLIGTSMLAVALLTAPWS